MRGFLPINFMYWQETPSRLRNWHPFLPKTRLSTGNATEPRRVHSGHDLVVQVLRVLSLREEKPAFGD